MQNLSFLGICEQFVIAYQKMREKRKKIGISYRQNENQSVCSLKDEVNLKQYSIFYQHNVDKTVCRLNDELKYISIGIMRLKYGGKNFCNFIDEAT